MRWWGKSIGEYGSGRNERSNYRDGSGDEGLPLIVERGIILCMVALIEEQSIDRTAFEVVSLTEQGDERAYWWAKTPADRLIALEIMRQIVYGYDPSTTRLQRVLEIARNA